MKINELDKKTPVFSLEIFPPKKTAPIETIYNTLDELSNVKPDFISVTFGAGGSVSNNTMISIASTIKDKYNIESVAHMPCIYLTKEDARNMLDDGVSYEKISSYTGLSLSEIEELANLQLA